MLGEVLELKYIRAIEENARHLGLPLAHLMESAGKCVADFIHEIAKTANAPPKVAVVAGRGGNAGDGFVTARYLSSYGYEVVVLALYSASEIVHPDARTNFELLKTTNARVVFVREERDFDALNESSVVVDAILGTGVKPPIKHPVRGAIEAINSSKALKIAIDVPSGIDPDRGFLGDVAVKADYTVAMHYRKKCYESAPEWTGRIVLCNIGIPVEAEEYVGPGHVRHLIKQKDRNAKKGDGGRVTVIGGSVDFVGAPVLAALAALRGGADLVYVVVPESIRSIVASFSPDLIVVPLGRDYLDARQLSKLERLASISDSIVLGPGMSLKSETVEFVDEFVKYWSEGGSSPPLIVDADALKAAAQRKLDFKGNAVLTPHRGEFKILAESYGLASAEITQDIVRKLSAATRSVVLLKGPVDIVCTESACMKNKTGTPAMSTGGTGDVLSGLVASLVKRTDSLFEAAFLAAYINGRAGEIASSCMGDGMTASDMLKFIPRLIVDPTWRGECSEGGLSGY
uniref:Bifunctional NAD(P)H-hydrate repair enzyme n=1 Tax=Fervidicoccus fontis TaxID=683846 RepID=A0A7J3ZIT1_9CREN